MPCNIKDLPVEVLAMVFEDFNRDFFSRTHRLHNRPPAILQVCRSWRTIAISYPDCWSHIAVLIYPQLRYSARTSSRQSVSTTPVKIMQNRLTNYFSWAKN